MWEIKNTLEDWITNTADIHKLRQVWNDLASSKIDEIVNKYSGDINFNANALKADYPTSSKLQDFLDDEDLLRTWDELEDLGGNGKVLNNKKNSWVAKFWLLFC